MKKTELLIIFLITIISCTKKPVSQTEHVNAAYKLPYSMYIKVENGLNLRSEPDIKSRVILVIPYREPVLVTKESDKNVVIDNIIGKWVYVNWRGKTGWLFNGYLIETLFMLYNIIPYDSSKLRQIIDKHYPNKDIMKKSIYDADINMFNEKPLIKPGDEVIIINKQGVFEDTIKKIYFSYIFGDRDLRLQFDISKKSLSSNQCIYIKKSDLLKMQNNLPVINNLSVIEETEIKNKLIEKVYNGILSNREMLKVMESCFSELRVNPQNRKNILKEIIKKHFQLTVKCLNRSLYIIEFKRKKTSEISESILPNAVIFEAKVVFLGFSEFINSFKLGERNYFFFRSWIPFSGAKGNVLYSIKDNKWTSEASDATYSN